MTSAKITPEHLRRTACVYIRRSSPGQVQENLESRRRQYELADKARSLGWSRVEVVDEDLGRSGSGRVERPGFQRLVSSVCLGEVGGVFALEVSRLARNSRDWHHPAGGSRAAGGRVRSLRARSRVEASGVQLAAQHPHESGVCGRLRLRADAHGDGRSWTAARGGAGGSRWRRTTGPS